MKKELSKKSPRERGDSLGQDQEDLSWQSMPQMKQLKELNAAGPAATM